jgi:hypothetical protein
MTADLQLRLAAEREKGFEPMICTASVSCRQHPLHTFEPCEVAIEADYRRSVFDGKRGKMRIRRQIAGGTGGFEQTPEYSGVLLAGMNHLCPRMP